MEFSVGDGSGSISHHQHAAGPASSSDATVEIRFPTDPGTGSAGTEIVAGVASGDGSLDKVEIMAYPW